MVACGMRHFLALQPVLAWLAQVGARRLVVDSRQVQPGDAFIAWPGAAHDARRFVHQALEAGACACLVDADGVEAFAFEDERIAALPDLKRQLGDLCAAFHGHPGSRLTVAAITGTNGKTSTAWWLAQASGLLGKPSGLVGTLGIGRPPVGDQAGQWQATGLTTPDPAALQSFLAGLVHQGIGRLAIEASSIGIVEHRLQGLPIHLALFTNFTQDHLDYHGSLEQYWAAKRQLFDWPTLGVAVINIDDPKGKELAQGLRAQRPELDLWAVGESPAARLRAADAAPSAGGMTFHLIEAGDPKTWKVVVPFHGHYNISNLLGVIAALRAMGHALQEIVAVLPQLTPVPGRMQALGGSGEPLAVVDYAHTPDALEKALAALRPVAQARGGRLWCVFGCGGDRDRSKRPLMGAAAARLADEVVLTSDNPRSEDPERILADVRTGVPQDCACRVEVDRAKAVARALADASCRDVVLIAGKGHEDYQEIAGVRYPSQDVDEARRGLSGRPARGFMTLGDVAACLGLEARDAATGGLRGNPLQVIRRVHTDTRTLQPGDLYVALRGDHFDGHDFLTQARGAGAVAAIVEHGLQASGLAGVTVPDTLQALQTLARAWRRQLQLPVVAVTGSNGKTTVTQMVSSILQAWQGERAGGTRGNLNNHIGVPLSVLTLKAGADDGHRAAVFELGMNHPGEVPVLADIVQPTVALINNAQREHQEFMQTVEAVARENGAVLQSLSREGAAVIPLGDAYAPLWRQMAGAARLWGFSWEVRAVDRTGVAAPVSSSAATGALDATGATRAASRAHAELDADEVRVHGCAAWDVDHWQLALDAPHGRILTQVHLPGRHNVHNAVAAATAALAAGAPLEAVAQGLSAFRAVNGRSRLSRLQHGARCVDLIDDSYNANPDSVRAAVEVLVDLPGPRALILGDMGEVGEQGVDFHEEVGRYARQCGIEHLWTLGPLSRHAAAAFGSSARHFESMDELTASLAELIEPRHATQCQAILVKGSRFMRMERAVKALESLAQEAH